MSDFDASYGDWPPVLCETEEEVDEAVDYIASELEIVNDGMLRQYGEDELTFSGGVTVDDLFDEGIRMQVRESSISGTEYSRDICEEADGRSWYRPR